MLTLYKHFHDSLFEMLKGYGFSHWMDRIDTFLYPQDVSDDDNYQVRNAVRAIGSGGLKERDTCKGLPCIVTSSPSPIPIRSS